MTVTFRSGTTPDFDSSPYAVPYPAGVLEGDLLLLQIHAGVEVPDGWTLIPETEFGIDPIFYRIAEAGEPVTVTVTVTASGVITAAMLAFYSSTSAALKIEQAESQYNATSFDRTWPAVSIEANESMVCCLGTILGNAASAPPAGFDERYDTGSPRMYAMTKAYSAAGTYGTFIATGAIERESNCRTIVVAEGTPQEFSGPQYRGRSAGTFASADGSHSVAVPTELVVGDFMLLQIMFTSDRTPTLPAGWTLVSATTGTDNLYIYSKVAEVGDIGATITATYTAGANNCFMGIVAYFSPRGRTIVVDASVEQTNGSSTDMVFASATPSRAPSALAYFGRRPVNTGITADGDCAERWEIGTSTRAYFMNQLFFTASATGTRTNTSGSAGISVTVAIVLVEEVSDCKPSTTYTYNGVSLTAYCNSVNVQHSRAELPRTRLGSTGAPYAAGVGDCVVQLEGDWNATVDALLAVDALRGTLRTAIVSFDDCTMRVITTWTDTVRVRDWRIITSAVGKLEWRATLGHNGLGVRTVQAS